VDENSEQFANPYGPAKRGYVVDVIAPAETRKRLVADLDALVDRPPTYPDRAHDNVPL
jgi:acetyl-CoA/propionyl-CoA carboxylase carboxyl transferase subunit